MAATLVMTLIGPDRPGLVDAVASRVREHGGNWLESRMCRLGGQFAGILRVEISEEAQVPLLADLQALEARGLSIQAHIEEAPLPQAALRTVRFELVGQDRPGIVREITSGLARHGANVEEMQTYRSSAPWSGEILFHAQMVVSLPASVDVAVLRGDLEKSAADLMVDLTLSEEGETLAA